METTQMPIYRPVDKEVIYVHNGILCSSKKAEKHAISSNMNVNRLSVLYRISLLDELILKFLFCIQGAKGEKGSTGFPGLPGHAVSLIEKNPLHSTLHCKIS